MSSLAYRLATAGDQRCIIDTWVDSYRSAHAAGMIAMDDWKAVMSVQVGKVLERQGVTVHVAHKPDEPPGADVYGWLCVERGFPIPSRRSTGMRYLAESHLPLVHYCYVKQSYRRLGLARRLFKAAGVDPGSEFLYSCKTGAAQRLASKVPLAKWSPLIVRHPK